ncbi:hypothetical protein ABE571_04475 [Stenotrophomonas sp. TWI273]|uniref:hypothetical protein n=1 Tax=Stenotrophomonas sp. TWI273 TaxID=3136774 RepID=UPI00320A4D7A
MEYSDDYLREYLPRFSPAIERVPRAVVREIERRNDYVTDSPDLIARSAFWTYALFSEISLRQYRSGLLGYLWRNPPWHMPIWPGFGTTQLSFGLFDSRLEAPGIGFILDVPGWDGPEFAIVDSLSFPRLGKVSFPFAIRQTQIEHHVDHPKGATSACWAQCKTTSCWGVLTAGHAFENFHPGQVVNLASGSIGSFLRSYFQPIDAAFVLAPAPAHIPAQLPVASFAAVGQKVFVDVQTGPTARTVVDVSFNCGVVNTRQIGVTFCLDEPESPGDSGALIRTNRGEALGIYRGALLVPGAPSGSRGFAQNFEQAILALNVVPYL